MPTTASFLPVAPSTGTLRPVGIDRVTVSQGFWARRQKLNYVATIPHCLHWETVTGWIGNFTAVRNGTIAENRAGREFSDSEVYKLLEAMAWEVGRTGDADLDEEVERIGQMVADIQCEDGYLSTMFGNPGQAARWSDFAWGHELYCLGHLLQAAVARIRTGRYGVLVDVARKAADFVCETFADGARPEYGGHPEVELGLAELGRATGERRYIEQARRFIDRRGQQLLPDIEWSRAYYQDDVGFRDADVLRGHAVRALYLAAAAVDVAVELGDTELLEAAQRQYDNAVARRTYITGGMGSHHQDEAFGDDYELPPDRAYSETCAGIASVMTAWRLCLATGDMRYGDIIERTLYNVLATAVSEKGTEFYYTHTLHRRTPAQPTPTDRELPRAQASLRAPWFSVSCCPTNIARTTASLAAYVASTTEDAVQIHQYMGGTIHATLPAGEVELRVVTDYPAEETIRIDVAQAPENIALELRIPAWAKGATVGGASVAPGCHRVAGLTAGDRIELVLPVAPRLTQADPRIDAVRGTVAVERGPEVLCVESVDLPDDMSVEDFVVDQRAQPRVQNGRVVIAGHRRRAHDGGWPYGSLTASQLGEPLEIPLIPYHAWANRGPSTMRVWLPVEDSQRH